ncbi:hypothetical protein HDU86_000155 [Geranomyces michiganensis]|nr:hypothetical protein HDU86_000155 [Geranomyces michiganensis]
MVLHRAILAQLLTHFAGLRPSSVALLDHYGPRSEEALKQQEAMVTSVEGFGSLEAFKKAVGGPAVGSVKLQVIYGPTPFVGGTLTVTFMKGETNADPNFKKVLNLPFESEQDLTVGNWLFVTFALRGLFVKDWATALNDNDLRTREEVAEWPIICQSSADGQFLSNKHAPTSRLNAAIKLLARAAGLDDRYISLKSNRRGFAQAGRSIVGLQQTRQILNHDKNSKSGALPVELQEIDIFQNRVKSKF